MNLRWLERVASGNMTYFHYDESYRSSLTNYSSTNILKSDLGRSGQQRYSCKNIDCNAKTFMLEYPYEGCVPDLQTMLQHQPAAVMQIGLVRLSTESQQ